MKITKLGHCCLLLDISAPKGVIRILTDPGMYSKGQNELTGIYFVLITHEHADHYHVDSVKAVMANNPQAKIITNSAVATLLKKENIACSIVGHGQTADLHGIVLKGWGTKHAIIYKEYGQVENTGYFIGGKLWYPGDNFTPIDWKVEILALPVVAPWMKSSEAIEYAIAVKPKKCFPVHDAFLEGSIGAQGFHRLPKMILEKEGIDFIPLEAGQSAEF
jgi:L-ascorbate metabolism protein UlaG (beta-lactamase superfamily)